MNTQPTKKSFAHDPHCDSVSPPLTQKLLYACPRISDVGFPRNTYIAFEKLDKRIIPFWVSPNKFGNCFLYNARLPVTTKKMDAAPCCHVGFEWNGKGLFLLWTIKMGWPVNQRALRIYSGCRCLFPSSFSAYTLDDWTLTACRGNWETTGGNWNADWVWEPSMLILSTSVLRLKRCPYTIISRNWINITFCHYSDHINRQISCKRKKNIIEAGTAKNTHKVLKVVFGTSLRGTYFKYLRVRNKIWYMQDYIK